MFKNKIKMLNISELALKLGLINLKNKKPLTHTLRFWETKFKQLKPKILAGRRRYYSPKDVEMVKMIFFLLKTKGMTINGAIKAINENLKHLDEIKTSSIKAEYYKKKIKNKSINLLNRIKKLNGKKNTH
jgi:DNA-binding transcriptional MerR regulator|tara:strand:+ start:366 stop:755 length:390 start_codon:yes stop_codon:yes gene_type:complete